MKKIIYKKKATKKRRRKLSAAEKHILLGRSGMYVLLGGVNSICILNYEICPLF